MRNFVEQICGKCIKNCKNEAKHVAKFAKHYEKHAEILQKTKMTKSVPISLRNIGRKHKNGTKMSRTQLAEKMRKANEHFCEHVSKKK